MLIACNLMVMELIHHHRNYHCECINSQCPNVHVYTPVNDVYIFQSSKSVITLSLVGKLMEAYTGPWTVVQKL